MATPHPTPTLGTLYLVPTPLDFGCDASVDASTDILQASLPSATIAHAARLQYWVSETAKSCRAFLKRVDAVQPLSVPLQQLHIHEMPRDIHKKGDHAGEKSHKTSKIPAPAHWTQDYLNPILNGHDMGLISEAGMPAIADPGSALVRAVHEMGARVVPLVGPISMMLALAASGLNGQNFAFIGYLPQQENERKSRILELWKIAEKTGQSQLFIETPYRNGALWTALLSTLPSQAKLLCASGLTLNNADIQCESVSQWHKKSWQPAKKIPAIFGFGI